MDNTFRIHNELLCTGAGCCNLAGQNRIIARSTLVRSWRFIFSTITYCTEIIYLGTGKSGLTHERPGAWIEENGILCIIPLYHGIGIGDPGVYEYWKIL